MDYLNFPHFYIDQNVQAEAKADGEGSLAPAVEEAILKIKETPVRISPRFGNLVLELGFLFFYRFAPCIQCHFRGNTCPYLPSCNQSSLILSIFFDHLLSSFLFRRDRFLLFSKMYTKAIIRLKGILLFRFGPFGLFF